MINVGEKYTKFPTASEIIYKLKWKKKTQNKV